MIVMDKLRSGPPNKLSDEQQLEVANELFPTKNVRNWKREKVNQGDIPSFTKEELTMACDKIKEKKAPGPDGLPPEIIKAVVKSNPDRILRILNRQLKTGSFPKEWKTAKLVLIEKSKPGQVNKAYRPICLLNVLGKLMEQLLLYRLKREIENNGDLAEEQHGFRDKRSTVCALKRVQEIADEANERVGRKRCIFITLDVRNAFNTVPWEGILKELRQRKIAAYLYNMISSYLEDRILYIGDNQQKKMTCGVTQDSV